MNRRLLNRKISRAKAINKMSKRDAYNAIDMVEHQKKRSFKRFNRLRLMMYGYSSYSSKGASFHRECGLKILQESPHHKYLVFK